MRPAAWLAPNLGNIHKAITLQLFNTWVVISGFVGSCKIEFTASIARVAQRPEVWLA